MTPADCVLRIEEATCGIGRRSIFQGLSGRVLEGERLHLGGPNGSGKTTALRCVYGTMPLTGGAVSISGYPAGSPEARALIGACIETGKGLYPGLSGRENLLFAVRLQHSERRYFRRELVDVVSGVEEEMGIGGYGAEKVRHYSAGMRARLGIARALLGHPSLLLLDEPTRSLDESGRELLWAALAGRPWLACVITSHLVGDRDRCHRTVTLAGRT